MGWLRLVLAGLFLALPSWGEQQFVGDSFSFAVPPQWKVVSQGPGRVNLRYSRFVGASYVQVLYHEDQMPDQVAGFFVDFFKGRGMRPQGPIERGQMKGHPFQQVSLSSSRGGSTSLWVTAARKRGSYSARLLIDPVDASRRGQGVQAVQTIIGSLEGKK